MANFEIEPGGYLLNVPLYLMGALDLASGVYAYWMLRVASEGATGYWATWADDDGAPSLALAARKGGVSLKLLRRAVTPYVDAEWSGVAGDDAFGVALEGIRKAVPVLLRLPPGSPVYPEGHHVVVRGWCHVLAKRYRAPQLIVNDPAVGERLLSREELTVCASPGGRRFHAFIARLPAPEARAGEHDSAVGAHGEADSRVTEKRRSSCPAAERAENAPDRPAAERPVPPLITRFAPPRGPSVAPSPATARAPLRPSRTTRTTRSR